MKNKTQPASNIPDLTRYWIISAPNFKLLRFFKKEMKTKTRRPTSDIPSTLVLPHFSLQHETEKSVRSCGLEPGLFRFQGCHQTNVSGSNCAVLDVNITSFWSKHHRYFLTPSKKLTLREKMTENDKQNFMQWNICLISQFMWYNNSCYM